MVERANAQRADTNLGYFRSDVTESRCADGRSYQHYEIDAEEADITFEFELKDERVTWKTTARKLNGTLLPVLAAVGNVAQMAREQGITDQKGFDAFVKGRHFRIYTKHDSAEGEDKPESLHVVLFTRSLEDGVSLKKERSENHGHVFIEQLKLLEKNAKRNFNARPGSMHAGLRARDEDAERVALRRRSSSVSSDTSSTSSLDLSEFETPRLGSEGEGNGSDSSSSLDADVRELLDTRDEDIKDLLTPRSIRTEENQST